MLDGGRRCRNDRIERYVYLLGRLTFLGGLQLDRLAATGGVERESGGRSMGHGVFDVFKQGTKRAFCFLPRETRFP